jgi:hypothetical protein
MPKTIKGEYYGERLEAIKLVGLNMLDEPAAMQSDPAGRSMFTQ